MNLVTYRFRFFHLLSLCESSSPSGIALACLAPSFFFSFLDAPPPLASF